MSHQTETAYIVRTTMDAEYRFHGAFTDRQQAEEYAAGLGQERKPRVLTLPLNPDPASEWRTIVDLDQTGQLIHVQSRIIDNDTATHPFFIGEKQRAYGSGGRTNITYRNIRLRLETETLDHGAAIREAQAIRQRACDNNAWPADGITPGELGDAQQRLRAREDPDGHGPQDDQK